VEEQPGKTEISSVDRNDIHQSHSRESPANFPSKSRSMDSYDQNTAIHSYKGKAAYFSSASNENPEVTEINYPVTKKAQLSENNKQVSPLPAPVAVNAPTSKSPLSMAGNNNMLTKTSKFLTNPNFGHSLTANKDVNHSVEVIVDHDIEILSPPKPPDTYLKQPTQQQEQQQQAVSSSRSHYHIPDNVEDSKNYYKNKKELSLQDDVEKTSSCCPPFFRSRNPNSGANAKDAKIVPNSPIRRTNMFEEFNEENNNNEQAEEQIRTGQEQEEETAAAEESENIVQATESDDQWNNEEEDLIDLLPVEEDFLGKSFVVQIQMKHNSNAANPNNASDIVVDDETAMEYSLMLQQMQKILELPSNNNNRPLSLKSPPSSKPSSKNPLETVSEDDEGGNDEMKKEKEETTGDKQKEDGEEGEEDYDDDYFEEESVSFDLSDNEERERIENEIRLEEFEEAEAEAEAEGQEKRKDSSEDESFFQLTREVESSPASQSITLKKGSNKSSLPNSQKTTKRAFLTDHLSYSEVIPKYPNHQTSDNSEEQQQPQEEVEELPPFVADHSLFNETITIQDEQLNYNSNKVAAENDLIYYQHVLQESNELYHKLIDLLSENVFQTGMQFLSSNEMIDESYSEDEILLKLEDILGLDNLIYIEDMYQLLNYQQFLRDYEQKEPVVEQQS
jgi:hypothetical protein